MTKSTENSDLGKVADQSASQPQHTQPTTCRQKMWRQQLAIIAPGHGTSVHPHCLQESPTAHIIVIKFTLKLKVKNE